MRKYDLLALVIAVFILSGCWQPSQKVRVIEYPPPDWTPNTQGFRDIGCEGQLTASCAALIDLGCDVIGVPGFQFGGLQPPYAVMECIHEQGEPPSSPYFKQKPGLDSRYRSYVIFEDGSYRLLIKKSEFKSVFAPIESTDEATSYAMVMTSLRSDNSIDPAAQVDYRVDVIEETHAEETSEGYLVYLFDWDRKMGCDLHSTYAVKVLVTRAGEVQEVERQEIYRQEACTDFGVLTLDEE